MKYSKNYILNILFIIVILYLFYNIFFTYEPFEFSKEECVGKPYIKYDDNYFCFDKLTKNYSTMSLFNIGKKMCEINPNGNTLVLKDPLLDNLEYKKKTNELCNPLEVSVK